MIDEFRASSSFVSHTRDMRWQSMDSRPFHTLLKSCTSAGDWVQSREACKSLRLCSNREYYEVLLRGAPDYQEQQHSLQCHPQHLWNSSNDAYFSC